MKIINKSLFLLIFILVSCNDQQSDNKNEVSEETNKQLPYLTYNKASLFPGNGSLMRVEDGVALEDGRIVVVDQAAGLRLIEKDGSNRSFGDFKNAGFVHNQPEKIA